MTEPRTDEADSTDDRTRVATVLVENHRAFLRFLERRVGDRALAEDLLQDAFTRNLDRLSDVPEEGLVPWFYRVLRNAAIDRHHAREPRSGRWLRSRRNWPPRLSPRRILTGKSARVWGGWRAP
jgi:RNA polymerase sigma factor (sigma-70 family)